MKTLFHPAFSDAKHFYAWAILSEIIQPAFIQFPILEALMHNRQL